MELYRIRQKSTGLWYGKKRRYEEGPWRKRPERYLSLSALVLCLKSVRNTDDVEIVTYSVVEKDVGLPASIFLKKKG